MASILSGAEARQLRIRNDWSLQDLANRSDINKAYLSEFENGKRILPDEVLTRLRDLLHQREAGRAAPRLREIDGHWRLELLDPDTGAVLDTPSIAHVRWTDASGSSYKMYVGEP